MSRRVVITGIGCVTPYGVGVDSFWRNCLETPDIVAPVPEHWHEYATLNSRIWAPLPDIDFSEYGITRLDTMQQDRASLIGLATTKLALEHAGLSCQVLDERRNTFSISAVDPNRSGVYIGTGALPH